MDPKNDRGQPIEPEALPPRYDHATAELDASRRWSPAGAFSATPDSRDRRYVVMMPLPPWTM